MIINTVVLAGRLTADATIIECQERAGRFSIEFRMALSAARKASESSQGDKTTFITAKLFVSEKAAEFFSRMLYKGREVVVTGSLASHTTIANQGSSGIFYYVDAKSVEVVPDVREARSEELPAEAALEAPAKAAPRQFQVQRPGINPPPPQRQPQSEYRPPVSTTEHYTQPVQTPAQLYRDKGVQHQPVVEADADDLMRW